MKMFAIVQPKVKTVDVFSRKIDATYFHVELSGRVRAFFKEVNHKGQLPKGFKVNKHT